MKTGPVLKYRERPLIDFLSAPRGGDLRHDADPTTHPVTRTSP